MKSNWPVNNKTETCNNLWNNHIDGVVQERRNSSVLAIKLSLSCTNPSIYTLHLYDWGILMQQIYKYIFVASKLDDGAIKLNFSWHCQCIIYMIFWFYFQVFNHCVNDNFQKLSTKPATSVHQVICMNWKRTLLKIFLQQLKHQVICILIITQ